MNSNNCPACDSPLNGGECDLCRSLEQTANAVSSVDTTIIPPVWNWEQFYILTRNDEIAKVNFKNDAEIEARIQELQEADRQAQLLSHSIRIRIMTDDEELKSRGITRKQKQSQLDMKYKSLAPIAGLPRKSAIPKTQLEKTKAAMSELGIDFDKLTKEINFDEL